MPEPPKKKWIQPTLSFKPATHSTHRPRPPHSPAPTTSPWFSKPTKDQQHHNHPQPTRHSSPKRKFTPYDASTDPIWDDPSEEPAQSYKRNGVGHGTGSGNENGSWKGAPTTPQQGSSSISALASAASSLTDATDIDDSISNASTEIVEDADATMVDEGDEELDRLNEALNADNGNNMEGGGGGQGGAAGSAAATAVAWEEEDEEFVDPRRFEFENIMLCEIGGNPDDNNPVPITDVWNADYVRLPCSRGNTHHSSKSQIRFSKWDVIVTALRAPMRSVEDLEEAIFTYNPTHRNRWNFSGLSHFLNEVADNTPDIFRTILPGMAQLALRVKELCPTPIPLLRKGGNKAVTLSQLQVASLLANAFFCTFPRRNDTRRDAEYGSFPSIHFNRLFAGSNRAGECDGRQVAKLKGLFWYFGEVVRRPPTGCITFHRHTLPPSSFPDWAALDDMYLRGLEVRVNGTIEDDGVGMVQMDFANKMIGGGVLGHGAVQEEIRFIINPELIISRLFTEELDDDEAVVMTGAQRYSSYRGYADSFEWAGGYVDRTPRDNLGRIKTEIVAVDAVFFAKGRGRGVEEQYKKRWLVRELNKAYVGFVPSSASCFDDEEHPPAIATGNWGCGAFHGDPELKSLIQLMSAAVAGRDLVYFTFGDETLARELKAVHASLCALSVGVGQLFEWVWSYYREVVRGGDSPGGGRRAGVLVAGHKGSHPASLTKHVRIGGKQIAKKQQRALSFGKG
ncbi:hypothetical protein HK104_009468 [Borealophlyctis nickersoniae]|nr:hypothetical protein HK104_009468 [Borealophlyctis nickersoniae]